ncbi:MAG: MFS transporter, partial [Bacteroidales bacterium]|nr:MFS transporter [Bacteroidales bacterium]
MPALKKTIRENRWICWVALACLVVPMFASYFFDDMFSSLSELFKNPEQLQLGWDMADYGFYSSGYSFLCIWGGLIVCGALLDRFGVRLVGSLFVGMMVFGAGLVTFAISAGFAPETSLTIAYIGCMLFGLGSEIAGVSVTRSIAKWFKGRNMALAMGLQLAIARFGTATAILIAPMIVTQKAAGEMYLLSDTNRPAMIGLAVLGIGAILWAVFVGLDAGFDRQTGETDKVETAEEDKFRISDIWKVLTNPRFLMIAVLCVTFYCTVIRFKKFGVSILLPLFGVDLDIATVLLAMIPFFTILF